MKSVLERARANDPVIAGKLLAWSSIEPEFHEPAARDYAAAMFGYDWTDLYDLEPHMAGLCLLAYDYNLGETVRQLTERGWQRRFPPRGWRVKMAADRVNAPGRDIG